MLIADSFTFGFAAVPFQYSFADYLNQTGKFEAINMGFPGADPVQYLSIIEKYLKVIKPDEVAIFFVLENENDLLRAEREPGPNNWFIYPTNKGWFNAFDLSGHYYKSINEIYNYYIEKPIYRFNKSFLGKTVLGTKLLSFLEPEKGNHFNQKEFDRRQIITNKILIQAKKICNENNIEFKLILLPMKNDLIYEKVKNYNLLFKDINYLSMSSNEESDFSELGMHLNNKGHQKFGYWLSNILMDSSNKN